MKVEVMVLVVRDTHDNSVYNVYPVKDMYSSVQMEYPICMVSPDEIKAYVERWMGKNHLKAINAHECMVTDGIWYDEQEAKDLCGIVGFMRISIEEHVINIL